jgi:hypothetical protein
MRRLFFLTLASLLATPVFAELRDEIIAADQQRVQATVATDINRLGRLLSDQLLYTDASGRTQNKAEYLNSVRSSQVRYTSFDYSGTRITAVTDDVATLGGKAVLNGNINGIRIVSAIAFLSVWKKENGAWHLFAYQSSKLSN